MSVCFKTDTFLSGVTRAALLLPVFSLVMRSAGTGLFPSTVISTIFPSVARSFLPAESRTLLAAPLSRGPRRAAAPRTSSGSSLKDIEIVEEGTLGVQQAGVEDVAALESRVRVGVDENVIVPPFLGVFQALVDEVLGPREDARVEEGEDAGVVQVLEHEAAGGVSEKKEKTVARTSLSQCRAITWRL